MTDAILADPVPDAARNLGISIRKCWSLIAADELCAFKCGRRTLVSRRAQRDYVDRKEREAAA